MHRESAHNQPTSYKNKLKTNNKNSCRIKSWRNRYSLWVQL